jgi:hypothetical protein
MPFLAVNKDNPSLVIGTASTYDNIEGSSATAPGLTGLYVPLYFSVDGGNTWNLQNVVPSNQGQPVPEYSAISVGFGAHKTIYAATQLPPGDAESVEVFRSDSDPDSPLVAAIGESGTAPYLQSATVKTLSPTPTPGKTESRVFVAYRDTSWGSGDATIIRSLDAEITNGILAGWGDAFTLDQRDHTSDFVPRVAIHRDGVIYGAFYRYTTQVQPVLPADVIVVRDDNWASSGASGSSFIALTDPTDNLPGKIVVSQVTVPWLDTHLDDFGQERIVGGDLSIAVDPTNSRRVYLAYADGTGSADYSIHVICSTDGGNTWSGDRRTVLRAKNFSVAINELGQVGLLYQQIYRPTAGRRRKPPRWLTKFEFSSNDFTEHVDFILADVPAMAPIAATTFGAYIGDYANLIAVGKDFYGIFCANNSPVTEHFPNGVTYQRNHDFVSRQLFDLDNHPIQISIDPFFFHISETDVSSLRLPPWMQLIVAGHLPLPPPDPEVVNAQIIDAVRQMSPEEKKRVLSEVNALAMLAEALARELSRGSTTATDGSPTPGAVVSDKATPTSKKGTRNMKKRK